MATATTQCLRMAQWVPTATVAVGQGIVVQAINPLKTQFTVSAFPEAPQDGFIYGRTNASWAKAVTLEAFPAPNAEGDVLQADDAPKWVPNPLDGGTF